MEPKAQCNGRRRACTCYTYWKFSADFPNTKSAFQPSSSLTVPDPEVAVSRVERTIPLRPSLHSTGIEIVCDCWRGSYEPAQVNLPSETRNEPSNKVAVFVPVKILPSSPMTATGTVVVQPDNSANAPAKRTCLISHPLNRYNAWLICAALRRQMRPFVRYWFRTFATYIF